MKPKKNTLLITIVFVATVLLVAGCSTSNELPQAVQPQSNQPIQQNELEMKENSLTSNTPDYSSDDGNNKSPSSMETFTNDSQTTMNEAESVPTSSEELSGQLTEDYEINKLFTYNNRNGLPFANAQSYFTLMDEANDRIIAIVAHSVADQVVWDYAFFDVTEQARCYRNKTDVFIDMTELNGGDPYDGVIERWLIYPDGFVYGCYSYPIDTPNNECGDYGGMGQIIVSDGELKADYRYGVLPTGVSAFILNCIEAV